jgi:hypothetical protein
MQKAYPLFDLGCQIVLKPAFLSKTGYQKNEMKLPAVSLRARQGIQARADKKIGATKRTPRLHVVVHVIGGGT